MFIIKYKKIFVGISVILVILSLLALFSFGLNIGIDFKGGALTEVAYKFTRPNQESLNKSLELLKTLSQNDTKNTVTEVSFNSIGPSVGRELTRKAIIAIILVSLAIICFIAFAFRKVSNLSATGSHGVASWKYGLIAIVTLLHDVAIPVGLFATLAYFYGAELNTLFVVAILTILGLSVSDTIVIFDRIRENLKNENKESKMNFSEIVGKSLEQSYVRSISTSFTVILVLLALFFFGPVSTKYFALMLTAGMFFGTYSSIFLASPLLVLVSERQKE